MTITPRAATPLDAALGRTLRVVRLTKGRDMAWVAKRVGVTYQQISKYENGESRMSVARLHAIARALEVPLDALLVSLPPTGSTSAQEAAREAMRAFAGSRPGARVLRRWGELTEHQKIVVADVVLGFAEG